ncbi:hypothetical protein MAIT1_04224 [Magnetofaba australis IT-1]|uniref:Uncharacterized protein n=1 Tax=Magnetofaba australis IT-1 TaxID=1434232 RepID=A0A1Y2K5N8_9PROT|nr:hypothetical protein MAIT1_04224 [Magnetofaba australis IT-1]
MCLKMSEKLTKKFLFSLPEGKYLVSNTYEYPGRPCYSAYVSLKEERLEQWREIREKNAHYRFCHVYETKEDCVLWHKSMMCEEHLGKYGVSLD